MSSELLNYCITKLIDEAPPALNIKQAISRRERNGLIRQWSTVRFKQQQDSILKLPPDHPDYGLGPLWPYRFQWTQHPDSPEHFLLRISRTDRVPASARELILFSSVTVSPVPFPYPEDVFRATKARMLGRESSRKSGAVYPSLRAGVANVQRQCQGRSCHLTSIPIPDLVEVDEGG